jgi:hypothetical protein
MYCLSFIRNKYSQIRWFLKSCVSNIQNNYKTHIMKNFGKLILTMTITALFVVEAQAQTAQTQQGETKQQKVQVNRSGFVDKNNDGVCDNAGTGRYQGRGANFIDNNNDGICDNRQNGVGKGNQGHGRNTGQGNRHRHGQGRCCGYRR